MLTAELLRFHKGTGGAGQAFYTNAANGTALGTVTPAIDVLHACPVLIPEAIEVTQVQAEITTGGTSGALIRLGIYRNVQQPSVLYPGKALYLSGTLDGEGTGLKGESEFTGNSILKLDSGVWWLVYTSGTNAPVVRSVAAGGLRPLLGFTQAAPPVFRTGLTVSRAFAALPSTFPASAAYATAAQPIFVLKMGTG